MNILIIGGGGMLGHKMYQTLIKNHDNVFVTFRKSKSHYKKFDLFDEEHCIDQLDVLNKDHLLEVLNQVKPDHVINCVGLTTRKIEKIDHDKVIYLNSFLPNFLNKWCVQNNKFLFHFSTDCVFSGNNGPYKANDFKDSRDIYGLSKALGEVNSKNALTIRTSIVGRELENKTEFFEWIFSRANDTAAGYKNVFYSGVTTLYLSQLVNDWIESDNRPNGLLQIGSEPISKLELIKKLNKIFSLNIQISANFQKVSNKVLKCIDFQMKTGLKQPKWDEMLTEFQTDNSFYERIFKTGDQAA